MMGFCVVLLCCLVKLNAPLVSKCIWRKKEAKTKKKKKKKKDRNGESWLDQVLLYLRAIQVEVLGSIKYVGRY